MTANPTEVMTEQEKKLRDYIADGMNGGSPLKLSSEQRQTVVHIIDRLNDQSISLRSSRDEYQTALELKQKWMVEADAKIERLEAGHRESERQIGAKRDEIGKLMDDLSAARAEVSRLSGELASRPAKELVEAARNLVDAAERAIEQCPCSISERNSGHRVGCFAPALSEAVDRMPALSQASSADALSAPANPNLFGAPGAAKKDHLQEGQRKCYRCGAGVVDQAEMEEECFGCAKQDREELQQRVSELEGQLQDERTENIRLASCIIAARDKLIQEKYTATYHELYRAACPQFDEFEPWKNLEELAAMKGGAK